MSDSGEKKHPASAKKLRDQRKKGQVAVSKDVGIIAKLAGFYLFFFCFRCQQHFVNKRNAIFQRGISFYGCRLMPAFAAAGRRPLKKR